MTTKLGLCSFMFVLTMASFCAVLVSGACYFVSLFLVVSTSAINCLEIKTRLGNDLLGLCVDCRVERKTILTQLNNNSNNNNYYYYGISFLAVVYLATFPWSLHY